MKVLDRYLTRELFLPILYCSMSLVFLILIADLFNNIDDLLSNHTPGLVILKYYLCVMPFAFVQTIHWAAWFGTLFLLVNLGFHNETTAMKAAGLKIMTIVKPVLFIGFLIGIGTFLIGDKIVPPAIKKAQEVKESHISKKIKKAKDKTAQNVTYFSGGDQLFYFRTFSPQNSEVTGVIALWLGKKNLDKRQKMVARRGVWDETRGWEFEDVTEYLMDNRGKILGEPRTFTKKVYPDIIFTPAELNSASSESDFLSYRELKGSMQKLKDNGVNIKTETVDLHARLATPWQALVMMLLTVPFLGRTVNRRAIAFHILLCVGTIFAYHLTGSIGLALGKAGKVFPFLSAWAGNIIFGLGAFFYLDHANY